MYDELEQLIDLVAASRVSAVTLEAGGRRVTIEKGPAGPRPAPAAILTAEAVLDIEAAEALEEGPATNWVTAPMVGVFHHAEPPVSPGVRVESGQIVGAIESMKLMNDIRSERAGLVLEAAVEDGSPVEYGQPLFLLGGVNR